MKYLVRCRGGLWHLDRSGEQFAIRRLKDRWLARYRGTDKREFQLYWNGTPQAEDAPRLRHSWGGRPAWLPIAWQCCEADPDAGPGFASAILDAEPGDDTPALVACDWLEERGVMGLRVRLALFDSEIRSFEAIYRDLGWSYRADPRPATDHPPTVTLIAEGLLAAGAAMRSKSAACTAGTTAMGRVRSL